MFVTRNRAASGMPSGSSALPCKASFAGHALTQGGGVQPKLLVKDQLLQVGPGAPRAPTCSSLDNLMNGLASVTLPD
jgi:hypothetical protein